jgi:hypothetical protein
VHLVNVHSLVLFHGGHSPSSGFPSIFGADHPLSSDSDIDVTQFYWSVFKVFTLAITDAVSKRIFPLEVAVIGVVGCLYCLEKAVAGTVIGHI